MTGYEAFCLFHSLKLHFNSDSYDYFRYNGKTSTSIDAFENRKDKYHFYKLSRRFSNAEQGRDFIVANLVHDSNVWIGHLLTEESDIQYRKRQKIIQALTYHFTNEVKDFLFDGNPNDNLTVVDTQYPKLLHNMLHGDVSIETICVLNSILNFLPKWDSKIEDTIHFPKISRTIKKYTPFINFEPTKYKLILKKEYDANTQSIPETHP